MPAAAGQRPTLAVVVAQGAFCGLIEVARRTRAPGTRLPGPASNNAETWCCAEE
jgi:hypothetical protein